MLEGFENINGSNNVNSPNQGADIISGNSQANALNGQAGNDILNGEGGDDTLIGGAGNDILIGGEGADTFVFAPGFGIDLVVGFELGVDKLDFSDFGPDFSAARTLSSATQDGSDAVLSLSEDTSVRLADFDIQQLSEDDFLV